MTDRDRLSSAAHAVLGLLDDLERLSPAGQIERVVTVADLLGDVLRRGARVGVLDLFDIVRDRGLALRRFWDVAIEEAVAYRLVRAHEAAWLRRTAR